MLWRMLDYRDCWIASAFHNACWSFRERWESDEVPQEHDEHGKSTHRTDRRCWNSLGRLVFLCWSSRIAADLLKRREEMIESRTVCWPQNSRREDQTITYEFREFGLRDERGSNFGFHTATKKQGMIMSRHPMNATRTSLWGIRPAVDAAVEGLILAIARLLHYLFGQKVFWAMDI